jgi:hypothetical protein
LILHRQPKPYKQARRENDSHLKDNKLQFYLRNEK